MCLFTLIGWAVIPLLYQRLFAFDKEWSWEHCAYQQIEASAATIPHGWFVRTAREILLRSAIQLTSDPARNMVIAMYQAEKTSKIFKDATR